MARILQFIEHMVARFPAGTFARISAVLQDGEDRAGFVRSAVERELQRRDRRRWVSGVGSQDGGV